MRVLCALALAALSLAGCGDDPISETIELSGSTVSFELTQTGKNALTAFVGRAKSRFGGMDKVTFSPAGASLHIDWTRTKIANWFQIYPGNPGLVLANGGGSAAIGVVHAATSRDGDQGVSITAASHALEPLRSEIIAGALAARIPSVGMDPGTLVILSIGLSAEGY